MAQMLHSLPTDGSHECVAIMAGPGSPTTAWVQQRFYMATQMEVAKLKNGAKKPSGAAKRKARKALSFYRSQCDKC